MTPKQKAEELYDKYFFPHYIWENDGYQVDEKLTYEVRKRFALIAVDEILEDNRISYMILGVGINKYYWEEVKKEIEAL